MNKKIILIDMDNTIADFDKSPAFKGNRARYNPIEMYEPGFFRSLQAVPGAKEALYKLVHSNKFSLYICTKPVASSPHSYSEKVEWINEHFPYLNNRIIMTQDKSLIKGDYLIDDNPEWYEFGGIFIYFDYFNPLANHEEQWKDITRYLLEGLI